MSTAAATTTASKRSRKLSRIIPSRWNIRRRRGSWEEPAPGKLARDVLKGRNRCYGADFSASIGFGRACLGW